MSSIMVLNTAVKRRILVKARIAAVAAILSAPMPAAAISERIVHDSYTGIAIGGFDPVAYFLDSHPVSGEADFEVAWDGAYWHFANPGNAAAFEDAPEVYAPAYGGHGVGGVARGIPQPGDPRLFAIHRGRLFFFFEAEDRDAFLADPDGISALADARWPAVAASLAE
jgi:YHS domain-containing protein